MIQVEHLRGGGERERERERRENSHRKKSQQKMKTKTVYIDQWLITCLACALGSNPSATHMLELITLQC
jgi:hypothetical protein